MWSKPMFEVRPDIFPDGYLTNTEIELWNIHFEAKEQAAKL
jgi:hypothetical protein